MAEDDENDDGVLGELHLRRLLVAVDGSPSSRLALAAAVTAARRDNATLTLLCVTGDPGSVGAGWGWMAMAAAASQDELDAAAQRILRAAVDAIPKDIPVTTRVRRGRPGPEIVAQAQECAYDAIILGARGVGRVGTLLGSVSNHVMHHARTPVFVAHAPEDAAAGG